MTYQGIESTDPKLTIKKLIELQSWILDPSSRPYEIRDPQQQRIIARSAGTENLVPKKSLTVKEQVELAQKILDGTY